MRAPEPHPAGRGSCACACGVLLAMLLVVAPVQAQQLRVRQRADLDFGVVLAGTMATVQPWDATAAEWDVQMPRNASGFVSFSLPAALTSGASSLPLSFGASSAVWSNGNQPQNGTTFDPRTGIGVTPSRQNMAVWLGGAVAPPVNQRAGAYTGVVTLTVVVN